MKKTLAILLTVAMLLALISGCGGTQSESSSTSSSSSASSSAGEKEAPATYTLNSAASTFPTNWNPHIYETSTDSDLLTYLVAGFYTFDYNENKDGYKVVPCMTTEEPIDVTADYVGQYGLTEESHDQAYILKLRGDLQWQDGTKITANDFVESAKRLLNPDAQNYRADSLYNGNLVIHNAQNYLYSGRSIKADNSGDGDTMTVNFADLVLGADGTYETADGSKVYFGLQTPYAWMGGSNSLEDYYGAGYITEEIWTVVSADMDDEGYVAITDEVIDALFQFTSSDDWGNETRDDLGYYVSIDTTYPEIDFSEVGMFAKADDELVIVLDKPLKGFYLLYSLTDSWLVKTDLYDECTSLVDGVYTNTYGTSAETTVSYGPYILTSFQADKQYVFERNEKYFEIMDNPDLYQTTKMVVDFVPEATTRLEMFLQGKLDAYGLTKDDMETYSRSDNCYFNPGDSTYAMVFNPDLDALKTMQEAAGANINKTIITIPEFRMAMSLGMNRADFCLATSPTNNAAFALYSNLIISDPEAGTAYRTTDIAKQVLVNFWGLNEDIGDGKLYADIDEAIESITGYNLTKAQQMFDAAYDKAIEAGLMDEDDVVEICVGTPNNTSTFYNNGYEYIVNNYTEAVKGTKLEGKLTFTRDDTLGNSFATYLKNNKVDMLFGVGWTGSTLDPYGLMEAYVAPSYQYDPSWDTTTVPMTVEIEGVEYTASIMDWYYIMAGETKTITAADGTTKEFSCGDADEDPATRLMILGEMENIILMQYDFIPIMDASTATLKGMQYEYYTEEYVFGMGHGDVKYYTYNYTDAEWDEYVAANNGELDYT